MPRQARAQRLTVMLVKPESDPADLLKDAGAVHAAVIDGLGSAEDNFFYRDSYVNSPKWVAYLSPHTTDPLAALSSSSASAVLLVEFRGQWFVFTFGYGRHLLDMEHVVHDFGLKVVLNSVERDQLRSVNSTTIDELSLHTRTDASRNAPIGAFGMDVSNDLLRSVAGVTVRPGIEGKIEGRDQLTFNWRGGLPDLQNACRILTAAYSEDTYKQRFEFVDNLRAERDPSVVALLDEQLVAQLVARDITNMHLALPETIDGTLIAGIRFTGQARNAELQQDPRLSTYLDSRNAPPSAEALRRDKLIAIRADDETSQFAHWTVYRCLVAEVNHEGDTFVLTTGQWFKVGGSFRDDVYAFARNLAEPSISLPACTTDISEAVYLVRARDHAAGELVLLDQQLVRGHLPNPVEICDLMSRHRAFVHVKRRGSSSTLSHLFAQGLVSAELLLDDPAFRVEADRVITTQDNSYAGMIPEGRPDPNSFEVSYVVMTRGSRNPAPFTLPFFSLVNLRSAAQRLQRMGFRVSVGTVPEAEPVGTIDTAP